MYNKRYMHAGIWSLSVCASGIQCCTIICIVYCAVVLCVLKMLFSFTFSDGMSRSGVFITCMSEIERVKVEGTVDIFQTVKAARAQRPHMVYTSVSDGPRLCNPTFIAFTKHACMYFAWVIYIYLSF